METYLIWLVAGFGLVIVELLSGSFYLLMLGVAAFGGAAVAYAGQGFGVQAVVAALLAVAGCYGVHLHRARNSKEQMVPLDAGQPASFEGWVDQGARLARVRYRGASWDALVGGDSVPEAGAMLYVESTSGNTLKVSTRRPA